MTTKQDVSVDFSVVTATPESGNSEMIQISLNLPPGMSAHKSSQKFYQIMGKLMALHAVKQADYGSKEDPFANVRASREFGVPPWLGAIIRLNDKVNRLKSFALKGALKNETVIDSMDDIAVYAVIAHVLFEEEQPSG